MLRTRRNVCSQSRPTPTTRGATIGETTAAGGVLRVILDGHARTLHLHARRLQRRRVIYRVSVSRGVHHLRLVDVRGFVALEGLAIASRTG